MWRRECDAETLIAMSCRVIACSRADITIALARRERYGLASRISNFGVGGLILMREARDGGIV